MSYCIIELNRNNLNKFLNLLIERQFFKIEQRSDRGKHTCHESIHFIFLLLFSSRIGMLAWISDHYTYQFDLTANKRHSLSSDSIDLLKLLDKEVIVHAYTTDEVTQKAIAEIISRYQQVKSDFRLKLLNPDIDIEQAQRDGIVMDKPFAFVIYYDDRMEHIASLSEQAISNALLRLNRRQYQQGHDRLHGKAGIDHQVDEA